METIIPRIFQLTGKICIVLAHPRYFIHQHHYPPSGWQRLGKATKCIKPTFRSLKRQPHLFGKLPSKRLQLVFVLHLRLRGQSLKFDKHGIGTLGKSLYQCRFTNSPSASTCYKRSRLTTPERLQLRDLIFSSVKRHNSP